MTDKNKQTDADDTPRTGTSVEWRGGETPTSPVPEEDVPRTSTSVESRGASGGAGTQTDSEESNPPRG
jgi:hypothetical protein